MASTPVPIHPPGEKRDWAAFSVLPAQQSVEYVKYAIYKVFGDGLDIRNYNVKVNWTKKEDSHMTLIACTKPEDYPRIEATIRQANIKWQDIRFAGSPYFVIPHKPGSNNSAAQGKGFWVQGMESKEVEVLRDQLIKEFGTDAFQRSPLHVTIAMVEYSIKPAALDNTSNFVYRVNN